MRDITFMVKSIPWEEFLNLRSGLPIVDARSQGEFHEGHIPSAINIPLLNNEERVQVGTTYRQAGKRQAIKKGFELVGPRLNEIVDAAERVALGRELLVHCWRGGMRSSNFADFVAMAGIKSRVLQGGYKTYRTQALEKFKSPLKLVLISGSTGSGKSEVLRALKLTGQQIIDLEALANHKGSAFGGLMMPPQPTTEQFENLLFEELLRFDLSKPIWVEDESIAVGKIFLPGEFWKTMRGSPVAMLSVDKPTRVQRLVNEYGPANQDEFLQAMIKITKKLGGQNFKIASEKLEENQMHDVMEILLTYYDKAYNSSMQKRSPEKIGEVAWNGEDPSKAAAGLIALLDK